MRLKTLTKKLEDLKKEGFIESLRRSSTGIGYTLETKLELDETNIPVPDLGGRVEIKTARRDASSLVTLFTYDKDAWIIHQKEVIKEYGYLDKKGRQALKSTVHYDDPNSLDLYLKIDEENNILELYHTDGTHLASWDLFIVISKFHSKLAKLLFVLADRRRNASGKEEFHYNEAYLLTEPAIRDFKEGFREQSVKLDLRMHLKESGAVRNRGTGFRAREKDMIKLYSKKKRLI